jgi:TetR/AcrR family transcriptional regulator, repressor for uid operon
MPKVVAEYKAQARARILDVASRLFRQNGFRATTMDDIAREMGVSKGALYLYFRTKNELLAAIQKQMRTRILEAWTGVLDKGDVAEGIVRPLDMMFNGEVSFTVWLEFLAEAATDPELRKLLEDDTREDRRAMRRFLRTLQERGRISQSRDVDVMAEVVLLLLVGSIAQLTAHGRSAEARRQLVRAVRFALND